MPYRGFFREGGKRGSGVQGLVGNELLHHSFQAYEVWSVLQQVFPDGAGLPARNPACADQEQACVMKEACTASLCIASRWSATRWYHQPTKARQPLTACNGWPECLWPDSFFCRQRSRLEPDCNGARSFSGKYSRRPGFCGTKIIYNFLRKHRSSHYNPDKKIPSLKGLFFTFRLDETRLQNPEDEYLPGDPIHELPQPAASCSRLWSLATGQ